MDISIQTIKRGIAALLVAIISAPVYANNEVSIASGAHDAPAHLIAPKYMAHRLLKLEPRMICGKPDYSALTFLSGIERLYPGLELEDALDKLRGGEGRRDAKHLLFLSRSDWFAQFLANQLDYDPAFIHHHKPSEIEDFVGRREIKRTLQDKVLAVFALRNDLDLTDMKRATMVASVMLGVMKPNGLALVVPSLDRWVRPEFPPGNPEAMRPFTQRLDMQMPILEATYFGGGNAFTKPTVKKMADDPDLAASGQSRPPLRFVAKPAPEPVPLPQWLQTLVLQGPPGLTILRLATYRLPESFGKVIAATLKTQSVSQAEKVARKILNADSVEIKAVRMSPEQPMLALPNPFIKLLANKDETAWAMVSQLVGALVDTEILSEQEITGVQAVVQRQLALVTRHGAIVTWLENMMEATRPNYSVKIIRALTTRWVTELRDRMMHYLEQPSEARMIDLSHRIKNLKEAHVFDRRHKAQSRLAEVFVPIRLKKKLQLGVLEIWTALSELIPVVLARQINTPKDIDGVRDGLQLQLAATNGKNAELSKLLAKMIQALPQASNGSGHSTSESADPTANGEPEHGNEAGPKVDEIREPAWVTSQVGGDFQTTNDEGQPSRSTTSTRPIGNGGNPAVLAALRSLGVESDEPVVEPPDDEINVLRRLGGNPGGSRNANPDDEALRKAKDFLGL